MPRSILSHAKHALEDLLVSDFRKKGVNQGINETAD